MFRDARSLNAIGSAALLLLAMGCASEPTAQLPVSSPNLSVSNGDNGTLEVCKFGPDGSWADFSITATSGVLALGSSFRIYASTVSCEPGQPNRVVVWTPSTSTDPDASITITEVSSTAGTSLQRITFSDLVFIEVFPPQDNITVPGIAGRHAMTIFKNEGTPEICLDTGASNYGGVLPCQYPPPKCEEPGALNYGGELPCIFGKTFTIGPSSMEGHLKIPVNSWFNGGYSFKFKSNTHIATQFTVAARVDVTVTCPYGGGPGGTITIPLGTRTYNVPAGNTNWLPTGDANSILSWMGAVRTPDLCGGYPMDNARGGIFTATVAQTPFSGTLVDFRFKYRDPAAKGKVDTNCTDPNEPKRNDAATCGASWSQTVTDP